MSKNKKMLVGLLGILVLIATGIGIYATRFRDGNEIDAKQVESYTVPQRQHVFVNGNLEPRETEVFGLDSSKGRIETVHVQNGDTVEPGADIVTYKREEVSNQISQIELQIRELRALGATTADQVRNLESQLAELRRNETTVEQANIQGKVYVENINVSEGISAQKITVQSEDLIVKGTVGERDVLKLQEGAFAELTIVSSNEKSSGIVESVSTRPSGETQAIPSLSSPSSPSLSQYEVIIALDSQENLKEGFHVQAKVIHGETRTLLPSDAVFEEGEKTYAFIIDDGVAKKKEVEITWLEEPVTAESDPEITLDIIAVKGISQGQQVILNPKVDLKEGDRVE
jgi:HlyD family secretion protein